MRREWSAPGRVNLLGEHTDYTGGLVMPIAIPFRTVATITPRDDRRYSFTSEHFEGSREMPVDDRSEGDGSWSDYPVGVLRELQKLGIDPPAFSLSLRSNVPLGSGLSSSASVEVASAVAMLGFAGRSLPLDQLALLCQRAENLYVHAPSGIMDQFVVAGAEKGHALLLNTRTLTVDQLPLQGGGLADTKIVICNSMVKHSVAKGAYGDRRREVETGQAAVLARFPELKDLGEATLAQVEACRDAMPPASFLRCRHIVTENARVRDAADAMRAGDPARLGALMLAGHRSMRDDFQASCTEIDFLVDTAETLPGCFGGRMTGGGFGGCTVNLVQAAEAERFQTALKAAYREHLQLEAETYLCEAVDGALRANETEPGATPAPDASAPTEAQEKEGATA